MREACQRAVETALGRPVTQTEARDIEMRVARHMRLLARQNAAKWSATPEADRLTEAGKAAAQELVIDAQRRKANLETRVLRMQALEDFVDEQVGSGAARSRIEAFDRILAPRADAQGAPEGGAVDQRAQGMYGDGVRSLIDVFEAGKRRGVWKYIPFNEPGTNAMLRRALAGLTEGVPPEFQRMAKTAHDYIELMRQRYNAAGGAIGRLEDWGEPHRWSDVRVLDMIKKRGRQAVVDDFANAAVRGRYVHEDGTLYTTDEIRAFMDEALTTITTDGANKRLRGERPDYATSVAANRHRAHREIHLRPDAIEDMLNTYSELGAMESMLMHMRTLARDVALIETFGPNADLTAKQMMDAAYDRDLVAFPDQKTTLRARRDHAEYLFDHLAGNAQGRRNTLNATAQALRSWNVFTSLGFTTWSSITDPVVMQHVARARGLDQGKLWINDVAMFAGQGRRWAKRAGLITDTVAGYADRVSFDHLTAPDLGARAASFTLKVTGLNWVTEARRGAWGLTMMDAIGHLVRYNDSLGALKSADDSAMLRLLNVDEATWSVWRLAKLETRGTNHTILSPQAIDAIPDADLARLFPGENPALVRQRATTALLGIIKDETNTAVTTAGSRERAAMLGDQTKSGAGTIGGELRRAIVLFRSYPWTFMTRQLDLARSIDGGVNRFAYGVSLVLTTWLTGILINWIYDILNGRDPGNIDPSDPEGWRNVWAGLARGGGLGFITDFLFANSDPNARSQSLVSSLTGPVLSDLDDVQQLTLGNINQYAANEETNVGPEAVRFAQRNLAPNWWQTKVLFERYLFQALQEEMQPGYNARQAGNQRRTRGTSHWWAPAEPVPDRAPDFSRIIEGGDMRKRERN